MRFVSYSVFGDRDQFLIGKDLSCEIFITQAGMDFIDGRLMVFNDLIDFFDA